MKIKTAKQVCAEKTDRACEHAIKLIETQSNSFLEVWEKETCWYSGNSYALVNNSLFLEFYNESVIKRLKKIGYKIELKNEMLIWQTGVIEENEIEVPAKKLFGLTIKKAKMEKITGSIVIKKEELVKVLTITACCGKK